MMLFWLNGNPHHYASGYIPVRSYNHRFEACRELMDAISTLLSI